MKVGTDGDRVLDINAKYYRLFPIQIIAIGLHHITRLTSDGVSSGYLLSFKITLGLMHP